jgi:hypothetical protein
MVVKKSKQKKDPNKKKSKQKCAGVRKRWLSKNDPQLFGRDLKQTLPGA